MFHIFLKTLRDKRIALPLYIIIAILLLWLYILFFPSIAEQAEDFERISQESAGEFNEAFGLGRADFSRLESFLAVEQFAFVWPIMTIFLMISFGTVLLREKERGTADILLSQPVSRIHLFLETYVGGLYALMLFVYLSIFTAIPLAELYDISYSVSNYLTFSIIAFLFGLAILSFSAFISSIFSERGRSYMIIGGTLLLMQVATIIAAIRDDVDWIRYLSIFHYYDAHVALGSNTLELSSVLVLGITSAALFLLGLYFFHKKDIHAS